MKSLRLKFQNKNKQQLAGILDMPEKPTAYALYAHCFTCSKDFPAAFHICKTLASNGIAVLRFDFTGLGDSAGVFSETSFSSNIDDILAAYDYMQVNYQAPKLIVGHSLGGVAAIAAASHLNQLKALATTLFSPLI